MLEFQVADFWCLLCKRSIAYKKRHFVARLENEAPINMCTKITQGREIHLPQRGCNNEADDSQAIPVEPMSSRYPQDVL